MTKFITPMFVLPSTDELAKECCNETEHSLVAWCDSISLAKVAAMEANLDPNGFCALVKASGNPARCAVVFAVLSEYALMNPEGGNAYNLLDYYVSKTRGTLEAWLEAIDYFQEWFRLNNKKLPFVEVLNYIGDCAQNHKGHGSLKEKLAKNLDQFGLGN